MTNSLTARLLAEIERRMTGLPLERSDGYVGSLEEHEWGYLTALRKIVELHRYEVFADDPGLGFCRHDQRTAGVWPCETVRFVAEGLEAEIG